MIFLGMKHLVPRRSLSAVGGIPSLDGVRGLAVLFVLLAHTKVVGFDGQGAIGVFLFFALSGFLLTLPLDQREWSENRREFLRRYFIRRLLRIVPFYYLVLGSLWIFTDRSLSWYLSHLAFLSAEDHLWSIRQELIFYLLLPGIFAVVACFAERPATGVVVLGLIGFAVQSVLLWAWMRYRFPWASEPLYPAIFLYGVLACVLRRYWSVVVPSWVGSLILLLLLCSGREALNVVGSGIGLPPMASSPGWLYPNVFGFLCASFVLLAADAQGALGKLLEFPLLRLVGVVGYSMYLLHWYIFRALFALGIDWGLPLFLSTFAVTLVASCATFALIERPIAEVARRITRPTAS